MQANEYSSQVCIIVVYVEGVILRVSNDASRALNPGVHKCSKNLGATSVF